MNTVRGSLATVAKWSRCGMLSLLRSVLPGARAVLVLSRTCCTRRFVDGLVWCAGDAGTVRRRRRRSLPLRPVLVDAASAVSDAVRPPHLSTVCRPPVHRRGRRGRQRARALSGQRGRLRPPHPRHREFPLDRERWSGFTATNPLLSPNGRVLKWTTTNMNLDRVCPPDI